MVYIFYVFLKGFGVKCVVFVFYVLSFTQMHLCELLMM